MREDAIEMAEYAVETLGLKMNKFNRQQLHAIGANLLRKAELLKLRS